MKKYNLDDVIHIISEKKLNDIPSKGRNQWELLRHFDGNKVGEFIEEAKIKTKYALPGTYQESNWWHREIVWNIEKGNIEIREH